MHIYAFGSVCRGDIDRESDIDLLALVNTFDHRFDPAKYSIYSYSKIAAMWQTGSPFAWHLHLESRLLFAEDGRNFIDGLGRPSAYVRYVSDGEKFRLVFDQARQSLQSGGRSRVFDLSSVFLGIRNIATCFLLGVRTDPKFSRNVAKLMGSESVPMSDSAFGILERARILCTRSVGPNITNGEARLVEDELEAVSEWMRDLVRKARDHDRIQQQSGSAKTTAPNSE